MTGGTVNTGYAAGGRGTPTNAIARVHSRSAFTMFSDGPIEVLRMALVVKQRTDGHGHPFLVIKPNWLFVRNIEPNGYVEHFGDGTELQC